MMKLINKLDHYIIAKLLQTNMNKYTYLHHSECL